MAYGAAADLVVVLHLAFVGFVVVGGLAVRRWPRLAWVHLPAVAWGVGIEWSGEACPLTPVEHWLRLQGGGAGYDVDFIARYLLPVLYPAGLTRELQIGLGAFAAAVNAAVYGAILAGRRRRRPPPPAASGPPAARPRRSIPGGPAGSDRPGAGGR